MVNVTYTDSSSDMIYTADDGTQYLYNLGDMSFGESCHPQFSSVKMADTTLSHRRHGPRLDHGSRCRSLLLWPVKTEECIINDLPVYGWCCRRVFPVVLLG